MFFNFNKKNNSDIKSSEINNIYEINYKSWESIGCCKSIVLGENVAQAIENFRDIDSIHANADIVNIKKLDIKEIE